MERRTRNVEKGRYEGDVNDPDDGNEMRGERAKGRTGVGVGVEGARRSRRNTEEEGVEYSNKAVMKKQVKEITMN